MPNISENLYQIIFTIGIFVLGYSFLKKTEFYDKYRVDINNHNYLVDSENLKVKNTNDLMKALTGTAGDLSQQYGVTNPISVEGETTTFTKVNKGTKSEMLVSSIIDKLWINYKGTKRDLESFQALNERKYKVFNEDADYHLQSSKEFGQFGIPGSIVLIFLGLVGLIYQQSLKDAILEKQIQEKDILNCQSCSKKFGATVQRSKFPDGEMNKFYCKECFDGNNFTDQNLKAIDVIGRRISSLNSPSRSEKRKLKNTILSLNRWVNDRY